MTLRYSHLSPSHLLDAVEKLIDGTDATTGTSESEPEERQVTEHGTAPESQGNPKSHPPESNRRPTDYEVGRRASPSDLYLPLM
jgi:hypothetical protein